jgi:ubiquinone/menaquinone biosynthesis C-methylase UbiE
VIGIDATPEMVSKARRLAAENGFKNVEFRLGEIENLPVADSCVEVVLDRAGFVSIQIAPKDESKGFIREWVPGMHVENFVVSAIIEAEKPSQ